MGVNMSLGFAEILLILVIILIIFGAQRIPELAKALGKASYEFKKAKASMEKEGKELIEASEKSAEAEDKKTEQK